MSSTFFDVSSRLAERFCRGDKAAFDALVSRHRSRVFHLVHRMTRDHEWAEEITDEIFLEMHRSLPSFKHQSSFSTWLHRVAVNVCLEHLRKARSESRLTEVPLHDDHGDVSANPIEVAMNRESAQRIADAMESLSEPHRTTVMLFYLKQLSCAEIAQVLRVPRGTVKTRLFYATRTLRDRLRAEETCAEGARERGPGVAGSSAGDAAG